MKDFDPEIDTNETMYTIGNPLRRKLKPHSQVSYDRTMSLLTHGPQTLETLNDINWDHKPVGRGKPYGDYCRINGWIKEADVCLLEKRNKDFYNGNYN